VAAVLGSGVRRRGGGGGAEWHDSGKEVRRWLRDAVVVVDGGGATRTARQRQEVRWRLLVEDEQERKKIEPSWLYKD
jgi:hypothetical protein